MRSCLRIFASLVVVLAVAACSESPDSKFDSSSSETSVLGPNLSIAEIDIGLIGGDPPPKKICLGDRVWLDTDCDGIQDSGEAGVKNVTVNLYACAGDLLATTTTDADGLYEFCRLDAGDYYVEFIAPDGHFFSPQDIGSDDAVDSDADSKGMTACVTLTDKDDDTVDAGLCEEKKGGEGCTPGYWKNHHFAWVGYSPGDMYDTVFGVTLFPGMTLDMVIHQGGGGYMRIGRHSVAALLSAAHPDVASGATTGEVIAAVQSAVTDSGLVVSVGDYLEGLNEQDCPLSGRDPSR